MNKQNSINDEEPLPHLNQKESGTVISNNSNNKENSNHSNYSNNKENSNHSNNSNNLNNKESFNHSNDLKREKEQQLDGEAKRKEAEMEEEFYKETPLEDDETIPLEMEEEADEEDEEEAQWDGSESEFVESENDNAYEHGYSGVKISYNLTPKEILEAIKYSKKKTSNTKAKSVIWYAGTIACLVVFLITFVNFINYYSMGNTYDLNRKINLGLLVASKLGILGFVIWPIKEFFKRRSVKRVSLYKRIEVLVYPEQIIVTNDGKNKWEIPLDGTCFLEEHENMYLIFLPRGQVFVIPIRSIEPDFLADLNAMLLAGCKAFED